MRRAAGAGEQVELGVNEGGRVCHAAEPAGPEVATIARARAERTPQLPDLSSLGVTIDQKPYLGAPLLGGDQCIGHGLVVEGISHDPDDGAGWNVVHRANDLVHQSQSADLRDPEFGSLKVAPAVGMYAACAGGTITIPSAKTTSAMRGWTSFFMKKRTPEFSDGRTRSAFRSSRFPRLATPSRRAAQPES